MLGNRKNKKHNNQNYLPLFILVTIGVSFFFISLIGIKNNCRETGTRIDNLKRHHFSLNEQLQILKSNVTRLSRPDRIMRIAREDLGMITTTPETLIVVLEDRK